MSLKPVNSMMICDRRSFRLRLYKRRLLSYKFSIENSYQIAVGKLGYSTPSGLYLINSRAKNPDWLMPDSDWVSPELRGKVLPGGDPDNPIKARWLGVTDPKGGVGIHGTADDDSIGSEASHGCLRMHVADVIELYDQVKLYTPIVIL